MVTSEGRHWWPSEAERLVDLYEAGKALSSGERAAARREIAARVRREQSPRVIRREWLKFERSSYRGIEIGYIVAPHLGHEARNCTLEVHRIPPRTQTDTIRGSELLCHVLSGHGETALDGTDYKWGPHDSFHVRKGTRYQHLNATDEPAYLLVGQATPILEFISPYADVAKGDSYSDVPDDFCPEHPFTKERVPVALVGGQKWMSALQLAAHERRADRQKASASARVFLAAAEAVIERSEHRGDWKVGLIDRHLGFDNTLLGMYVHQLPPASHTETHKHGEAIVYVLSGHGHSVVEGRRYEWRQGDCIFVQPGEWHQHFNSDPEQVSQHLALYTQPIKEAFYEGSESVEVIAGRDEGDARIDARSSSHEWWR